ncbi:MAG: hypothetical protein R2685_16245 [Candidatus Nitrosocosmicus sp.]|nr:hypothetical protein [Candidatus Nitrosocosmicus sp.]
MNRTNSEYNYESVTTKYTDISWTIKQLLPNSSCYNRSRKWKGLPYSPNAINAINLLYDNIVAKNENDVITTNSVWHKTLFIESRNVLREYSQLYYCPSYSELH